MHHHETAFRHKNTVDVTVREKYVSLSVARLGELEDLVTGAFDVEEDAASLERWDLRQRRVLEVLPQRSQFCTSLNFQRFGSHLVFF